LSKTTNIVPFKLKVDKSIATILCCEVCKRQAFSVNYEIGCDFPILKCTYCENIIGSIEDSKFSRESVPVIKKD